MRPIRALRNLLAAAAVTLLFAPGCTAGGSVAEGDRALATGDAREAARQYQAALERGADPAVIADRLARVALIERKDRLHVSAALELMKSGDFLAAAGELKKALDIDPRSAETKRLLARALVKLSRFDEAKLILDDLVAEETREPEVHYLLSRYYYNRSDYVEARSHLRLALRLDPGCEPVKRALGILEKEWAATLAQREASARGYFEAGVRALYARNDEKAFESLSASLSDAEPRVAGTVPPETAGEAIADDYSAAALYSNLALACARVDRNEEALAYLEQVDRLAGGSAWIRFKMGRIYEKQGLWPAAVERYNDALAVAESVPGLRAALAFAYKKTGQYAESLATFAAAVGDEPGNPYLRYNLAIMAKKLGDLERARAELTQAKALATPGTAFYYTVEEHLAALSAAAIVPADAQAKQPEPAAE